MKEFYNRYELFFKKNGYPKLDHDITFADYTSGRKTSIFLGGVRIVFEDNDIIFSWTKNDLLDVSYLIWSYTVGIYDDEGPNSLSIDNVEYGVFDEIALEAIFGGAKYAKISCTKEIFQGLRF